MRTLVLDRGYQPHRIVSWQRAVLMLFDGKVEVVEEYDDDIRSVSFVIKMPAVVRLLRAVRGRRGVKFSRMNVATRDGFRCQYCGDKLPLCKLTYDHVIPRAQGGTTCWENIVMACYPCNGRKGCRSPEKMGMRLLERPVRPQWLPLVAFRIDPACSVPEAWMNWVYWHGTLEEDLNRD
jgi:5-methylcytosine-specific restriction endonuclease McrA